MNLPSPAEQGKLERTAQTEMLKKQMAMQAASAKKLKSIYIPNHFNKNMARLQCRSYPLSVAIIIDGKHTDFLTPHTFELEPGAHTVEMHHFSEDGTLVAKKEEVELKRGQRSICKLYFKEPKTLAEPIV